MIEPGEEKTPCMCEFCQINRLTLLVTDLREERNLILEQFRELQETLDFIVGEFQRLQPGGSPPPGGPMALCRWIRVSVAQEHQSLLALLGRARNWVQDPELRVQIHAVAPPEPRT